MVTPSELLISADSHVIEPPDLWQKQLPAPLRDSAPAYPTHGFQAHKGGTDPKQRISEMAVDGVSGEVLYPSLTMDQFGIRDQKLQEACLRVYNDWLIEYCSYCPERLFGIATIATYNIDNAIKEVIRCKDAGMRGAMVWQVPPEELAFSTTHYDKLWGVLQELAMPLSLHILTGAPYNKAARQTPEQRKDGPTALKWVVNTKLFHASNTLTDLIASGALERFPGLKLVFVENEASWLPFMLSQWDKYASRGEYDGRMKRSPSEYFSRQVYATFFNDPPIKNILDKWGGDNSMWSNDFPHKNSTWPNSRKVIERDLGALSNDVRANVLHKNVSKLYHLPKVEPLLAQ